MNKTQLKYGVGLRPPHYQWILENQPEIGWFEIISENFLDVGGQPRYYLEKIRADYPFVMHGVSLSIGSVGELNWAYLERLRRLQEWLEPVMVSDHLCWTHLRGFYAHDLLPIPYTQKNLEHMVSRLQQVQDFLARPLLLENPSLYVQYRDQEMSEPQFFAELCQRTGCEILLDLNNLVVNQHNLGWNPREYIAAIPCARIAQLHIAGHQVNSDVRIDTHDQPVQDEVWDLLEYFAQTVGERPTLLEWDDNLPEFSVLLAQIDKAQAVVQGGLSSLDHQPGLTARVGIELLPKRLESAKRNEPTSSEKSDGQNELARVQEHFLSLLLAHEGLAEGHPGLDLFDPATPVSRWRGGQVYNQAFYLRLRAALVEIFPRLSKVLGEPAMNVLSAGYLLTNPPDDERIKYVGRGFADYIAQQAWVAEAGVPPDALANLSQVEWALREVFDLGEASPAHDQVQLPEVAPSEWGPLPLSLSPWVKLLALGWDVLPTITSLQHGEVPERPKPREEYTVLVYRNRNRVEFKEVSRQEAEWLRNIAQGLTIQELISQVDEWTPEVLTRLVEFCLWAQSSGVLRVARAPKKETAGF